MYARLETVIVGTGDTGTGGASSCAISSGAIAVPRVLTFTLIGAAISAWASILKVEKGSLSTAAGDDFSGIVRAAGSIHSGVRSNQ